MTIIKVDFGYEKNHKQKEDKPCCRNKDGLFWCPELKWYIKYHCGFQNKNECDQFFEQTGRFKRI